MSWISQMFILQCRLQNNLTKFYREYPIEILTGIVLNLSINLERMMFHDENQPSLGYSETDGWGCRAQQVWSFSLLWHRGLSREGVKAGADSGAGSWTHLKACSFTCLVVEAGCHAEHRLVASACGCWLSHGSLAWFPGRCYITCYSLTLKVT